MDNLNINEIKNFVDGLSEEQKARITDNLTRVVDNDVDVKRQLKDKSENKRLKMLERGFISTTATPNSETWRDKEGLVYVTFYYDSDEFEMKTVTDDYLTLSPGSRMSPILEDTPFDTFYPKLLYYGRLMRDNRFKFK